MTDKGLISRGAGKRRTRMSRQSSHGMGVFGQVDTIPAPLKESIAIVDRRLADVDRPIRAALPSCGNINGMGVNLAPNSPTSGLRVILVPSTS